MAHFVYGRKPVEEWLKTALPVKSLFVAHDLRGQVIRDIEKTAKRFGLDVTKLERRELTELVGRDNHQGIAAEIELPAYVDVEDILDVAQKRAEPPFVVFLDGVQDPHNLGAIIRSADGAGVHGIIIPKDKSAGMTPAVLKVSAGAAAFVPIAQVTNLVRAIEYVKTKGLWIFAVDQQAGSDVFQTDMKGPVGLVLGSEGSGIRRLVREKCDFIVSIPMYGNINSLNVSVAAAILFFQVRRQRAIK
jgi:23S rRNA (guanosine2251-2'-O)-methyltransferase